MVEAATPAAATVEEKVENEEDAPTDKRQRVKDEVEFSELSCTPGSLISSRGSVLSTLQVDGQSTVLNGGCLNVGLCKGRYYVELKFLDAPTSVRLGVTPGSNKGVSDPCESFYGFDVITGEDFSSGTAKKPSVKIRATRKDVVGLLINLDEKAENKNSISTFVNGKRACEPAKLPDGVSHPLYPVVFTKGSAVALNTGATPWRSLPFTVRMVGDVSKADAEQLGGSVSSTDTEVVVLCGAETTDAAAKFMTTHGAGEWRLISSKSIENWAEQSGIAVSQVSSFLKASSFITHTLRAGGKHLYALGQNLSPKVRKELLDHLKVAGNCKIKAVVSVSSMDNRMVEMEKGDVDDLSLPTKEEGFADVTFEDGTKAQAQTKLDKYKSTVKLRQRVDLKPGDFFKTYMSNFTKTKAQRHKATAAKNAKEGETPTIMSEFSEDDWILASLRAEFHALMHAFKIDSGKDAIPSSLFVHYYRQYTREPFYFWKLGCNSLEEVVNFVSDTAELDEEGFFEIEITGRNPS